MDAEKAIELLSDYCDRGMVTLGADFKEAVLMGKKALMIFSLTGVTDLDPALQLLTSAKERSRYEPDPRD
ncbi:hypothetical protein ES708_14903 [subsurface metagenome]